MEELSFVPSFLFTISDSYSTTYSSTTTSTVQDRQAFYVRPAAALAMARSRSIICAHSAMCMGRRSGLNSG